MPFLRSFRRLAGCLLIAAFTHPAHAARDMAYEAEVEAELASIAPTAVEPFQQARAALDAGDYAAAVAPLRTVVAAAPQFSPALRRLGSSLTATGHPEEGFPLMEQAVALQRDMPNLLTLAAAIGSRPDREATNADYRRAMQLLDECRTLPRGDDEDVLALSMEVAARLQDDTKARTLFHDLRERYPDSLVAHIYAAYFAAQDEHWIEAEDEMLAAREAGYDPAAVDRFLATGVHSRAQTRRWVHRILWTIAAWAVGMAGLAALGYTLSVLTLRQIDRADPRVPITDGERRMRHVYRLVLNLAGAYYYISLPVVIVIVVGAAGALVWGFFAIGTIPIKIVALIIIGAIATVFTMIRSLFVKVDHTDPGRALEPEEAPGLWQLSQDVARDLDTRPIDEIRVTWGTDLCVYERGTWREKLRGDADRILVVGTAVLSDFKIADFRSVLAHEYGHFAHRDTAGGDIALRVQNDMMKFYVAMHQAGQATVLNLAFHFLRFYHFLFRRISHGASRLQEVLADRVAALHYGPAAFEGGLRHVVRQSVAFNFVANQEIETALKDRRPINNLYTVGVVGNASVEKDYEEAIQRPTSLDDTHPGPLDRFRLIAALDEPEAPAPAGEMWDFFTQRESLMQEMMTSIEGQVARHRT